MVKTKSMAQRREMDISHIAFNTWSNKNSKEEPATISMRMIAFNAIDRSNKSDMKAESLNTK